MSAKVLVVGHPVGHLEELFKKVGALHAKNNFAFALLVGNVFESDGAGDPALEKLLTGNLAVPLPTYFSVGNSRFPELLISKLQEGDGSEVCENLYFLGRKGQIKTAEGAIVQALGGIGPEEGATMQDETIYDEFSQNYNSEDVESLKQGLSPHILFTWEWPAEVAVNGKVQPTGNTPGGTKTVADICQRIKPRYHISFSENFYERQPFYHPKQEQNDELAITRFISMAPFGNQNSQKALYAFTLPIIGPVIEPDNLTVSPWAQRPRLEKPKTDNNYKFETGNERGRHGKRRRRGDKRGRSPPKQEDCFFCLSFRNLEKHLLVSIGDESYLASAKGPLPRNDSFETLSCSAHILIIPLVHAPTIASIPDPFARSSTLKEMNRFLDALGQCFASRKLGTVCWRLNRQHLVHAHWQVLPFPEAMSASLVREAFIVEAGNDLLENGFEDRPFPPLSSSDDRDTDNKASADAEDEDDSESFSVLISSAPDAESGKIQKLHIRLQLESGKRFDAQFGRRVMAKLLRLDDRINWKDCGMTFEEEVADTNAFKEVFKEFDFSLA